MPAGVTFFKKGPSIKLRIGLDNRTQIDYENEVQCRVKWLVRGSTSPTSTNSNRYLTACTCTDKSRLTAKTKHHDAEAPHFSAEVDARTDPFQQFYTQRWHRCLVRHSELSLLLKTTTHNDFSLAGTNKEHLHVKISCLERALFATTRSNEPRMRIQTGQTSRRDTNPRRTHIHFGVRVLRVRTSVRTFRSVESQAALPFDTQHFQISPEHGFFLVTTPKRAR